MFNSNSNNNNNLGEDNSARLGTGEKCMFPHLGVKMNTDE
jgi:hypothetical protein